jgi:hypothetical protein
MNGRIDHQQLIAELARNAEAFRGLLADIPQSQINWKPSPEKWNLLEIVCHLYDEEREDFRARLLHALNTPADELPPIDPEGWVKSRAYASRVYSEMLERFLKERQESVTMLRSLNDPDWKSAYMHPKYGPMSAEFFLANWLAHDLLHLRQILRTKYQYLEHTSTDSLLYAGEW